MKRNGNKVMNEKSLILFLYWPSSLIKKNLFICKQASFELHKPSIVHLRSEQQEKNLILTPTCCALVLWFLERFSACAIEMFTKKNTWKSKTSILFLTKVELFFEKVDDCLSYFSYAIKNEAEKVIADNFC